MTLFPLKFIPRLVPKMWGGRKLGLVLGKPLPPDRSIGESWELHDFPPGATGPDAISPDDDPSGWISSKIATGPLAGRSVHDLMLDCPRDLLGDANPVDTSHGPQFPLLIKFLDAREDLSVQVHPTPQYAAEHANAFVKNEAWHILHAEPGSRLLMGARAGVTPERFRAALSDGTADRLAVRIEPRAGETFYMPSGTLHALGAGILAYEVQTPSDTTYRVFDFNRIDPSTGKPRTLHVEQAMQCIQWDQDALSGRTARQTGNTVLARAPQWVLAQAELSAGKVYRLSHANVPIVVTCVGGGGIVESGARRETCGMGQTLLLPPSKQSLITPSADSRFLLATVPPGEAADLLPR